MKLVRTLQAALLLTLTFQTSAQIAGSFSVPASFPTIGAAITTLNLLGVAGPVTIHVQAGHTETATAGGYRLYAVAGTSSVNAITFRRSGAGANPVVVAPTGTATPASAIQDGVICLVGADHTTFDGIDIYDPNTTNPATMEFGYGFFKSGNADGCQYNTVRNCTVTLNRVNGTAGSGPSLGGSRGINLVSSTHTTQTSSLYAINAAGANAYNRFYGNLIRNCHIGLCFYGEGYSSPYLPADAGNDVGGMSAVTGNTVINFGGSSGAAANGIRAVNQLLFNASYNYINNNNGNGSSPSTTLSAVHLSGMTGTMTTILSNTIVLTKNTAATSAMNGVFNDGFTIPGTTLRISRNIFPSYTFTNSSSPYCYLIYNSAAMYQLVCDSNLITNVAAGAANLGCIHNVNGSVGSISSNTLTNVSTTNGSTNTLSAISYYSGNQVAAVRNNLISGFSANNGGFRGIDGSNYSAGGAVTGNTVTSVTGAAGMWGICCISVLSLDVSGNLVSSLSTHTGAATGIDVIGLLASSNQNITMQSNTIAGIYSAPTNTANTAPIVACYAGGVNSIGNITRNKIYDITNAASGAVSGFQFSSLGTANIYNNLIGNLYAPVANHTAAVTVFAMGTGTANVSYNSVYLNAASTGSNFGTSIYSFNANGQHRLRNNIFVNLSPANGTGIAAILRASSTSTTNYNTVSNNNLYYLGSASAPNRAFYAINSTATYTTLAVMQASLAPRDAQSVTELPPFTSTVGAASDFLDINTLVSTRVEGMAAPVSGIDFDYDANYRDPWQPDIGAWEGNYVKADVVPPVVLGAGFTSNGCSTGGRTMTVSVYDQSGVATGSLSPRVYYRVNFSLYSNAQGTLTAGTATNGTWSFNLTYSASPGDQISYFLVMQDQSSANSLTVIPSQGASVTDVNNVTVPPIPADTYSVGTGTLGGVYLVGAGQTYTSLTAAANAYNTSCLTGPVTFSLTDALYSSGESFPITFRYNSDASATNSLLIRPATGVACAITAGSGPPAALKLLNTKHITIDGIAAGGTSLTITSQNTNTTACIWLASSPAVLAGNAFFTAKNIDFVAGANSGFGVIAAVAATGDGTVPGISAGTNQHDIRIENNTVKRANYGFYTAGATTVIPGANWNWAVTNNTIGAAVSGTANIARSGIFMAGATDFTVSGNLVRNVTAPVVRPAGIDLDGLITRGLIRQNTITAVSTNYEAWSIYSPCGIGMGLTATSMSICANTISNITCTYSSGSARGITINTRANSGSYICNNMISAVTGSSNGQPQYFPAGIALEGLSGELNIDFNSVHLSGSGPGAFSPGSPLGAAALMIYSAYGNVNLRNNILSSTINYTNYNTEKNYGMYVNTAVPVFTAIDRNNFYAGGTANVPVSVFFGSDLNTLLSIQSALGGNIGSTTLQPVFASSTNLHLQQISANSHLASAAMPLAGISDDIDGDLRSTLSPDIGADEIGACSSVTGGSVSASAASVCAGAQVTFSAGGVTIGAGTAYQWQFAPTSGGTFTNVTGGSGGSTPVFTSAPLAAGVYYAALKSSCGTATAISNVVGFSVAAIPQATASAITSTACPGGTIYLAGSADVAATYSWTGPNGFSSAVQNPVLSNVTSPASGIYSMSARTGSCASQTATVAITVFNTPTITVTSASAVCAGGSATLVPSGAANYVYPGGSPVVYPMQTSSYSVTGTDANGCPSSTAGTVSIIVNPLPTVAVANGTMCSGSTFTINPSGAATYSVTGGSLVVSPTVTSGYSVTGSSNAGCVSSNTAVATISVAAQPTVTVNSGSVCSGQQFTFSPSGALSYNYSGGSPVISPSSTSIYTVTGTNSLGCLSAPALSTVTVAPSPTVSAAGGSVCAGTAFTLVPSGADNFSITGGSFVMNPSFTTTYSVTGINNTGCTSVNTVVITVVVNPLPTVTVNSGTVCSGRSFTLSPSGASTYLFPGGSAVVAPSVNATYSVTGISAAGCTAAAAAVAEVTVLPTPVITVNSGTLCSGGSFTLLPSGAQAYAYQGGSPVVSPTTTTQYTVTGTNTAGCVSNPVSATVTVFASPTIAVNSGSVCAGDGFTLIPAGASNYLFSPGQFTISGAITVNPGVTSSYSITGTSAQGCAAVNTAVATVTVWPLPTVAANGGTVCSGKSFTITPSGAATYSYSSGSPVVSPVSNTSYTVSGFSSAGCRSTNTVVITVTVLPTPGITVNSGSICPGQVFTITPSGADAYQFAGGSSTVSPSSTTSYSVTGTSTAGCTSSPVFATVTVLSNPIVSASGGSICAGSIFTFNPSGASTYFFSGGSNTVSPLTTSTYSVYGQSAEGCVSSNTEVVTVSVIPLPVVTVNSGSVCSGQSFTLTPSGAASYIFPGGSPVVTPNTSTFYPVWGSTGGCPSNTVTATITVFTVSPVTVSGPSVLCSGTPATLTAGGAASYQWSSGAASPSLNIAPTNSTLYAVTATDAQGCTVTAQHSVTVNPLPLISVTGDTFVCSGSAAVLTATGTALSYTWNNGTSGNYLNVTPSVSTVYSVTGTALNACAGTATFLVLVSSAPPVGAAASSTRICIGEAVTLSGTGASTYSWSAGISNGQPFAPSVSAIYSVTGAAATGCKATATVQVIVNSLPVLQISASADTICEGDEVILSVSGANLYSWTPSGGNSPSATIAPVATTVFTVNGIDANGCRGTAARKVHVEVCAGTPAFSTTGISISPNPFASSFSVKTSRQCHVEVYGAEGKRVFSGVTSDGGLSVDLSCYANGVYLVSVHEPGRAAMHYRMVKTE